MAIFLSGIIPLLALKGCGPTTQGQEESVDLAPYRGTGECGSYFETAPAIDDGLIFTDFAAYLTSTKDGTASVTPGNEELLDGEIGLQSWNPELVSGADPEYILGDGVFLGHEVSFTDGGYPWTQALWCPSAGPEDDAEATISFLGALENPALPEQGLLAVLAQCDPEGDSGCEEGEANYGSIELISSLRGALYSIAPGSCDVVSEDSCQGVRLADTNFVRTPDNLMPAAD